MPLPEAGEVGGDLHGAPVGRQEVQHQRFVAGAWAFLEAEEVLKARRDPRGAVDFVLDGDAFASR